MDTLSSASVIVILLLVTFGIIIEVIYSRVKKKKMSWERTVIISVISASTGFCIEKIVEIDHKINLNTLLLNNYDNIHNSSIGYLNALESLNKLDTQSPLKFVLQEELQFIKEKLNQITRYELILKREEVIPKWESLIANSNSEILATNIVSLDEWKTFSPTEGEESHRKALQKDVTIRRIFIYNGNNNISYANLLEKAKAQSKWGVNVRLLDGAWIKKTPYVSDLLRDIGTIDIVIFDKESVLLTNVGNDDNIISSTITNNQYKLKKSIEFYNKLWNESKTISQ